jgi:tripartite-type tricarboxylate transporter receptor subunit TctC
MKSTMCCLAIALCFTRGSWVHAQGQGAPDFYKNKQVRLIVGYPAGNDYDIGARVLAKYLAKHIPGQPNIIVQNMPQAGSVVAANFTYEQAPRDGTVIASFTRNLPAQAFLAVPNVRADPRRLIWLGATSFPGRACVASSAAPVKTPEDLLTHELIVGSTGANNINSVMPTVLNRVLGTKFRIVEGYKGTPEIMLAIQRGEVQGNCASFGQFRSYDQLFREGKVRTLFRAEESPMSEIPDAPSIFDFVKTEDQRRLMRFVFSSTAFGRPYVFPPDVPQERVALMRAAFATAAKDPGLVAEADQMKLDMTYRPPEELERGVRNLYGTPPELVEIVKKLVPNFQ